MKKEKKREKKRRLWQMLGLGIRVYSYFKSRFSTNLARIMIEQILMCYINAVFLRSSTSAWGNMV